MPVFVGVLLQGFYLLLVSVVGQWLFGLGVGFVAYTGISALTASAYTYVTGFASGLSSAMASILHLMGVFTALNIILSGVAAKFAIAAAGSATVKKLVFR